MWSTRGCRSHEIVDHICHDCTYRSHTTSCFFPFLFSFTGHLDPSHKTHFTLQIVLQGMRSTTKIAESYLRREVCRVDFWHFVRLRSTTLLFSRVGSSNFAELCEMCRTKVVTQELSLCFCLLVSDLKVICKSKFISYCFTFRLQACLDLRAWSLALTPTLRRKSQEVRRYTVSGLTLPRWVT